ncbi:hypothetical protein RS414_001003 [Morganella morganii]|nr:hypothetical protein [Morganella morganii]
MKNRIQHIEPQRDEYGFWSHPEIPAMEASDEVKAWLNKNNLEYGRTNLEDDLDSDDPAWIAYFENGNPDCSLWQPTPPAGDGWIMAWITDTDDGPACVWVRYKDQPAGMLITEE